MEPMSYITIAIAIFSVSLSIILMRELRFKRRRLKVSCFISMKETASTGKASSINQTKLVYWVIANAGRDDIIVTDLSVKPAGTGGELTILSVPLPKLLNNGEYFMSYDRLDEFVELLKEHNTEAIEGCIARDSVDRKWYASAENVKRINLVLQGILHPEKLANAQSG